MSGDDRTYFTSSMAVAAYLHGLSYGNGVTIRSARRTRGPKKFAFVFNDPQGVAPQMAIDFANSESRLFDDAMRSLKTILNGSNRS